MLKWKFCLRDSSFLSDFLSLSFFFRRTNFFLRGLLLFVFLSGSFSFSPSTGKLSFSFRRAPPLLNGSVTLTPDNVPDLFSTLFFAELPAGTSPNEDLEDVSSHVSWALISFICFANSKCCWYAGFAKSLPGDVIGEVGFAFLFITLDKNFLAFGLLVTMWSSSFDFILWIFSHCISAGEDWGWIPFRKNCSFRLKGDFEVELMALPSLTSAISTSSVILFKVFVSRVPFSNVSLDRSFSTKQLSWKW